MSTFLIVVGFGLFALLYFAFKSIREINKSNDEEWKAIEELRKKYAIGQYLYFFGIKVKVRQIGIVCGGVPLAKIICAYVDSNGRVWEQDYFEEELSLTEI